MEKVLKKCWWCGSLCRFGERRDNKKWKNRTKLLSDLCFLLNTWSAWGTHCAYEHARMHISRHFGTLSISKNSSALFVQVNKEADIKLTHTHTHTHSAFVSSSLCLVLIKTNWVVNLVCSQNLLSETKTPHLGEKNRNGDSWGPYGRVSGEHGARPAGDSSRLTGLNLAVTQQ